MKALGRDVKGERIRTESNDLSDVIDRDGSRFDLGDVVFLGDDQLLTGRAMVGVVCQGIVDVSQMQLQHDSESHRQKASGSDDQKRIA